MSYGSEGSEFESLWARFGIRKWGVVRRFESKSAIAVVLLLGALFLAGCGGSNGDTADGVEVEQTEDVARSAAGGVKVINGCALRPNTQCSGADLRRADLSGVSILTGEPTGIDLTGANLRGADLRGADLYQTSLRGADLSNADLSGADLTEAITTGADFSRAKYCNTVTPAGLVDNSDC